MGLVTADRRAAAGGREGSMARGNGDGRGNRGGRSGWFSSYCRRRSIEFAVKVTTLGRNTKPYCSTRTGLDIPQIKFEAMTSAELIKAVGPALFGRNWKATHDCAHQLIAAVGAPKTFQPTTDCRQASGGFSFARGPRHPPYGRIARPCIRDR